MSEVLLSLVKAFSNVGEETRDSFENFYKNAAINHAGIRRSLAAEVKIKCNTPILMGDVKNYLSIKNNHLTGNKCGF